MKIHVSCWIRNGKWWRLVSTHGVLKVLGALWDALSRQRHETAILIERTIYSWFFAPLFIHSVAWRVARSPVLIRLVPGSPVSPPLQVSRMLSNCYVNWLNLLVEAVDRITGDSIVYSYHVYTFSWLLSSPFSSASLDESPRLRTSPLIERTLSWLSRKLPESLLTLSMDLTLDTVERASLCHLWMERDKWGKYSLEQWQLMHFTADNMQTRSSFRHEQYTCNVHAKWLHSHTDMLKRRVCVV